MPRNVLKTNLRRIDRLLKHIPFAPWQKGWAMVLVLSCYAKKGMSLHIQPSVQRPVAIFPERFSTKKKHGDNRFFLALLKIPSQGILTFSWRTWGRTKKNIRRRTRAILGSPSGCLEGENKCVSSLRTLSDHRKGLNHGHFVGMFLLFKSCTST